MMELRIDELEDEVSVRLGRKEVTIRGGEDEEPPPEEPLEVPPVDRLELLEEVVRFR